jgi:uncharacterized damage-inducible protein DinB
MFRRIDDFTSQWALEAESTLKVLRVLTDASLAQPIVPGGRGLGFVAWHITGALAMQMGQAGAPLDLPADMMSAPVPARSAEIAATYERAARSVGERVAAWTDAMLPEPITFYGRQLPRGMMLEVLIRHQTHHRGQMTVLMRQAGLPVPGVYGPSKEEWAALGMATRD